MLLKVPILRNLRNILKVFGEKSCDEDAQSFLVLHSLHHY